MVTIDDEKEPICYKLPIEYWEWVMMIVDCANMEEKYYVDIL